MIVSGAWLMLVEGVKRQATSFAWARALWRWIASVRWGDWLVRALSVLAFAGLVALVGALVLGLAITGMSEQLALLAAMLTLIAVLVFCVVAVARLAAPALRRMGDVLRGAFGGGLGVLFVIALGGMGLFMAPRFAPHAGVAVVVVIVVVGAGAGLALVSFGPTLVSIVSQGAPAAAAPRRPKRRHVLPWPDTRVGGQPAQATPSAPAPPGAGRAGRTPWRPLAAGLACVAVALLIVLDLSSSPAPRPKSAKDGDRPAPAGRPPPELALRVDGATAEAAWRRGYRSVAERLNDATPIHDLALGPEACAAPAIAAVGAASSDGALAANRRLALLRARWLAAWSATQVASCSGAGPAILAVSIGQIREQPANARQRRLRLLVLKAYEAATEDAARRAIAARLDADPHQLELCLLRPLAVRPGSPRPCR